MVDPESSREERDDFVGESLFVPDPFQQLRLVGVHAQSRVDERARRHTEFRFHARREQHSSLA